MASLDRSTEAVFPDCIALQALVGSHACALGYLQEGRLTWANRAMREAFGFQDADALLGMAWEEFFVDPEEYRRAMAKDLDPSDNRGSDKGERAFKRKDGSVFKATHAYILVPRSAEQPRDAWTMIDPLRAGSTQTELKESEERYRNLVEGSFDGIFLRQKHRIVFANARLSQMLGYTEEELKSLDRWQIYHPQDRKIVQERTSARLLGDHVAPRYDVRLLRKDGTSFPAELDARVFSVEGEPLVQICVRDISERKRAEEERLQLVTAIEHTAEIIAITDTDGFIRYINSAMESITGYGREEFLGKKLYALGRCPHDATSYAHMVATLGSGKVWSGRIINRKSDGTKFETEISISPVRGEDNDVIGYVAVMRDVTNEVALENQLRHAAKMEALGTLAGGIAHDFNNILYVIMGFAEIALDATAKEARVKSYLRQVLLAANRAKDLVDQILTFSRQGDHVKQMISVVPLIEEALTFLRASIPTTIEIRPHFWVDTDVIRGDSTQVHQIIMNLCSNAAHAMSAHGGTLDVHLTREEITEDRPAAGNELTQGSYLRLSVQDSGHGMEPEIMERIFEPYFSTKEKTQGTGLGLAVVHGIVKDHGGAITVHSEPDKGTVFDVYLPLGHSDCASSSHESDAVPTGRQRILVVDDENAVISMLKETLQSLGYLVETSNSSTETLEWFLKRPDHFDLVVTDLTMPRMTGTQLARELLAIRSTIPIILCTGHGHLLSESEAKKLGIRALLVKPVTRRKLAHTIRKVLDRT